MKISTKGRYGLKAVMEIARQADNGHVSMRDLSQTTGISASYLEQLFKKLRAAGVLRSVRGAQGAMRWQSLQAKLRPAKCSGPWKAQWHPPYVHRRNMRVL